MKPLALHARFRAGVIACAALTIVGATACGGNQPAPATPSGSHEASDEAPGATNAQGSDNPNRALRDDECTQLGEYIADVCHETHTRQTHIEAWCSDMVSRTSAGTWVSECTKSVKYMDAVCFRSTDNAVAMMACDRSSTQ
jgi:hypothetical protein